ncbi:MAG: 16S rRNA (cytosine(967)-C(5))-methyltransferase RsmB [Gammaproteobacteria bacterium]
MNSGAANGSQARRVAAHLVHRVADCGDSLSTLLGGQLQKLEDVRQRALAQELSFGTLRWYLQLEAALGKLLQRPLRDRDRDIHALLLVGLYQLLILNVKPHAAVHETVEAARRLGKRWAVGLINGVLREAQRRGAGLVESVKQDPAACWSHPRWWIAQLQADWPQHWRQILEAGNERPPMVLRVNRLRTDRNRYLDQLRREGIAARPLALVEAAVQIEQAVSVERLPGFRDGLVSVQDAAAQLAASQLELRAGHRVLDACAAPGGKTGHILELAPALEALVAVDSNARRVEKIHDNLARLRLQAQLVVGDAGEPDRWWDGRPFDRILLDAPCSASGVVRRHPDIKLLRRRGDLESLSRQQQRLLDALWPLVAPGGILLYVTCSVFRKENADGVQAFLTRHAEARELPMTVQWGVAQSVGRQILPGEQGMDGFYLARLTKLSTTPQ